MHTEDCQSVGQNCVNLDYLVTDGRRPPQVRFQETTAGWAVTCTSDTFHVGRYEGYLHCYLYMIKYSSTARRDQVQVPERAAIPKQPLGKVLCLSSISKPGFCPGPLHGCANQS